GLGDLDECNGIERSITLTTASGQTETFNYFYVITEEFPVIGRCLSGTPDQDFFKRR
ncbi:MAG: YHYH protein, partial [Ekhidna sp.]|nr:YHYH protein [Ekhidna sp.]